MKRIYMDHAATTPMDPQVLEAIQPYWAEQFGNPNSLHQWGRQAQQALKKARQTVADCLHAQPEEVFFTSGATEADNWVLRGICAALQEKGRHLIISSVEHAAVDNVATDLELQGWSVTRLPVNEEGLVSIKDLEAALRPDTVLVSIIYGQNEIGTLQPIEAIGAMLRARKVLFHTDAVQVVGKLPVDLSELPVDYLSLSGHKIYGPKGIGALFCRASSPKPLPLISGGGQEFQARAGTENVAGIVGLAKAMAIVVVMMPTELERLHHLQERLISGILATIPEAVLNGPRDVQLRVPGNVHFSFPPLTGDVLVLQMDLKGIAVSSGSACSSSSIEPSRIVQALGKPDELAGSTLRFTMGRSTTEEDLERVIAALKGILKK